LSPKNFSQGGGIVSFQEKPGEEEPGSLKKRAKNAKARKIIVDQQPFPPAPRARGGSVKKKKKKRGTCTAHSQGCPIHAQKNKAKKKIHVVLTE